MGRFLNVSSSNTVTGYTKARVYTTPGTTTWTVPAGVNQAKVFVIGAGSCYRETEMCFRSSACCSGVATIASDYCLGFKGLLPGAGGGYAEKTITDLSPGAVMTISVGSLGGLTASVVSIGATTVTANNATEIAVNWNCTNNSTARDSSNDNPTSIGIQLPVCGYCNRISGYFNKGGTATGGDINRTGGQGVFIPWFCVDSCYIGLGAVGGAGFASCTNSGSYSTGYDYSFGGTRYNCACSNITATPGACINSNTCGCCFTSSFVTYNCTCLNSYHTTFGVQCNTAMPWSSCICQRFCSIYLCIGGGTTGAKYIFAGETQRASTGDWGKSDCYAFTSCPVGVGADAGSSASNGFNAVSENVVTPFTGTSSSGGGATSTYVCYIGFSQDNFSFVFGTNSSGWPCACITHMTPVGGSSTACYNLGFAKDDSLYKNSDAAVISLSSLQSETGGNLSDFTFGYGATLTAAGIGGGGNRLNPAPGNGAVVIVY